MENQTDEDIITIHLGRIVSDELYDQIVKDIVKLMEMEKPGKSEKFIFVTNKKLKI